MKFAFQTIKALVLTAVFVVKWCLLFAAFAAVAFSPVIVTGLLISSDAAFYAFVTELALVVLFLFATLLYGDWEEYYEPGDIFKHDRFVGWKFNNKS